MKHILSLTIAVLALLTFACYGCAHRTVSEGERVGTIIKFSQEGLFHKTWEIEVIRGGMNGGSGAFGVKPFFATVKEESLREQCQKFFDSQQEVIISYYEKYWTPWDSACTGDDENCAYLTSIRLNQK